MRDTDACLLASPEWKHNFIFSSISQEIIKYALSPSPSSRGRLSLYHHFPRKSLQDLPPLHHHVEQELAVGGYLWPVFMTWGVRLFLLVSCLLTCSPSPSDMPRWVDLRNDDEMGPRGRKSCLVPLERSNLALPRNTRTHKQHFIRGDERLVGLWLTFSVTISV